MSEKQVAVVTGAGSGIGRAVAIILAKQNYSVLVADLDFSAAEETVDLVQSVGGEASPLETDVTNDRDCENLVKQAIGRYGKLNAAVNNAGIAGYPLITSDYTMEQWLRVIDVNLNGVFRCMRQEIIAMRKFGGGSIVNVSSILGLRGARGGSAYGAAKHGVVGLTRSAALECGKDNIRVNAICPGYVETNMTKGANTIFREGQLERAIQRVAISRFAQAEEIAHTIVWLCSTEASYITGVAMPVDGGVTAGF